jgi:protein-disulfide isomerase
MVKGPLSPDPLDPEAALVRNPTSWRSTAVALTTAVLAAAGMLASTAQGGAPAPAGDRPMPLELFLRRFYGLPSAVKVVVGPARPGPAAGVETVPVTVGDGSRAQTIELVRSADGRYVALARFLDLAEDPFAATAAALDLADRPALGRPQAAVTIVEYSDFQCPFCRRMSPVVEATMKGPLARDVRWVFKHFPLGGITRGRSRRRSRASARGRSAATARSGGCTTPTSPGRTRSRWRTTAGGS